MDNMSTTTIAVASIVDRGHHYRFRQPWGPHWQKGGRLRRR